MPAGHLPGGTGNGAGKRLRLAQRRKALGLTQEDLAALLGVERSTVVRWEQGETEPLAWIRPKLAKALEVPAGRLGALLAVHDLARSGGPVPPVPRQLPPAVEDFTGRAAELEALTGLLEGASAGSPGTVVISAIGGTAGVGKTALAVQWAHQVAGRFPDGQLYVNLRGFASSGAPVAAAEAVRGFLDALGVPQEGRPSLPDAQAGLYRSLLADKRMLIVLDNARDEEQVRPLLPASPASLVLVTSRNRLAGLAAAGGARLLSLDVFTHDEAVRLLAARLGHARAGAQPEAAGEIASLCACLPLALAVAASRAAGRPGFPLAAVADELRDATERLDALDAGDPAASVRAVFSWSYRQLSTAAARLFRLLGLHPGPDISVPAAASLAAIQVTAARRLLRELTRAHLVTEHAPGRYAFHDLLRAYAASQARDSDSEPERRAAIGRVLDHYLHTAVRAASMLSLRKPPALGALRAGAAAGQPAGRGQAEDWFEAEHQVLLAAVRLADDAGFDCHAWQLAWALMAVLQNRGLNQEWAATLRIAVTAATRLGDTAAQAFASELLARGCIECGDYDQARGHFGTSLELYRRLGDRHGESGVHAGLAALAVRRGRYADGLDHEEQSLRLYRAIGHRHGEANCLNTLGWFRAHLGDYQQARLLCKQALTLNAEVGDRVLEGCTWDSLGFIEQQLGNFPEAVACYERALRAIRETDRRPGAAAILIHLGDARRAAGELRQAREAWRQALAIFEDVHHPGAGQVRARLDGLAAK
jgi:tetratricopeptide (TPR) repeat protein/transcriptional regulator with XRE-family HTH domain